MFSIERWQEIFEGLSKNKLRTVLTGVSVASGIFILVILLGAGNGIQNGIQKQFEQDAVNRITIWPGVTQMEHNGLGVGRKIQLRNTDFDLTTTLFSDYIEHKSAVYSVWSGNIVYKKETGNYQVEGVHPDQQFIENASISQGRFINHNDILNYEKNVIIGKKVATDLFKKGENPLGEKINISGMIYKVVGVYTDPAGEREESRVFIPITTAQKAYSAGDNIRSMAFTLKQGENLDKAVAESQEFSNKLSTFLKARHNIAPTDEGALVINNSLEQAKNIYIVTGSVKAFFWFVGICTIIAGVVGVGNIMLIIVKERTKEIGIRKALGASPFSIITMILQEAVFITVIAGFSGLIAGLIVWEVIAPHVEADFFTRPEVDFNVAITTLIILIVAGAFAGFVPAYKAAKIRPIVALRGD
ncbi:ABC transporter permease [Myroides sp. JBRI-B21084]|uniref:ABC transporter permease n=1 Tax=Myroides sp. JBRI-B21084 TaxID=3119977 RepID=UPI0026E4825A|nr:ABC transporter permease [Paenimyroides cloacae]WKW45893.1 ABC transporter permease [Paenimyroides cloacae]